MLGRAINSILAIACLALAIALAWPRRSQAPAALPARIDPVDEEHILLDRPISDLQWSDAALNEVIETLSERARLTLYANWPSLEGAGIDRAAPVTLHLHNASLRKALNLLEENVGSGTAKLAHVAADGVVLVTTAEDAEKFTTAEIYNIRDLLDDLMAAQASRITKPGDAGTMPLTYGETSEFLVKLITETVTPETWRAGGNRVYIREFGGLLFVTHGPRAHREIRELLAKMRDAIRRHEPFPTTNASTSTSGSH